MQHVFSGNMQFMYWSVQARTVNNP